FPHVPDAVEGAHHDAFELLIDVLFRPEELGQVLHPLEIRHGHAAAVGEDVRDYEDASLVQDVVRLGRRRAVRPFRDDLSFDPGGVIRRQDAFQGARGDDVDGELQEIFVRDLPRTRESDDAPGLLLEREDLLRVEAFLAVDAAFRVGDRDDLRALLVVHQAGVVGPDVAEALDRDARAFQVQLDLLAGLAGGIHHAPRRRFVPAERAADHERLARDDARLGEPLVHRDRVHDPRHRLAVRVHVRGRDVLLRADDDRDFGGVPAGHALELPLRHLLRVADYAAFRAAVRDAHDRALPGHPARKGADLVQGDVPVVPDPAL